MVGTCIDSPPHMDGYISHGRRVEFRRLYLDRALLTEIAAGFIEFSTGTKIFGGYDVLEDRGVKEAYAWWETHGVACPILQQLAFKVLGHVTSSSCCKRTWRTYGNLYSVKKSKLE